MSFDPTKYPFDTVVYITDTIGGQDWQGSGVLIAPDEVLTASHVVYIQGVGTATDIQVTPAYSAGSKPFGTASGTYIHYFQVNDVNRQLTAQQSQYDYAVIHLSTNFTRLGFMGLQSDFSGGAADVTGYPATSDGLMENSQQTVVQDPNYTVLDGTSLGEGSSGGPVWITENNGSPYVVGIVSTGTENAAGTFMQISDAAFNQIEAWVAQDNASSLPCFRQGTAIATPSGERPVESLAAGDLVLTASGAARPVIWMGHRRVDCRSHARPQVVWPVRIQAGAFRPGQPHRDLFLSPDHAVSVDGVLIPIRCLVNGRTIVQQACPSVTYWHVELDRHDVLLAEGMPCESFLDTGNRRTLVTGQAVAPDPCLAWQVGGYRPSRNHRRFDEVELLKIACIA
jgi:V8-like Glu-specific endopeptidase